MTHSMYYINCDGHYHPTQATKKKIKCKQQAAYNTVKQLMSFDTSQFSVGIATYESLNVLSTFFVHM